MSPGEKDPVLNPGTIVGGRYRVIQDVGEGPLDRIYEAQDVDLHERAILRVIRASLAGSQRDIRRFEDQARILRTRRDPPPHRLLELSRDNDYGPFAALSNSDSLPVDEVLPLLVGVDGAEPPGPPAGATPSGYRFPAEEGQIELDTLSPETASEAPRKEPPRYAEPKRPKKLETLELEAMPRRRQRAAPPRLRRGGGALPLGRVLPLIGVLVLLAGGIVGLVYYLSHRGDKDEDADPPSDESAMVARELQVRITFHVEPRNAKMRIAGRRASGNVVLVPRSGTPFVARFTAGGYHSTDVKVVPDRSRTVMVVLNKKR